MENKDIIRGSIWRKWDLQIHTPFSYLNNQFGNDFDNYVKNVFKKALESNIFVIGITDYFCIEGYKKIKSEYLKPSKLKELSFTDEEIEKIQKILILPNIEFRLNKLVGTNRINFHVIFSSDVSIQDIEESFLHELDFVYEGNPQDEDEKQKLKIANLESLGKKLKEEHENFKTDTDLFIGMKTAVVDDKDIMALLNNKKTKFKEKYLVFVPSDEDLSKIDWDGQDHLVRKVIIQKSDGLFSANENTIAWGLGKKHNTEKDFIKEFKTLKPCICGSDAHKYDELFKRSDNKFCWIKADPTFEGLKQIIYELDDRVKIQQLEPEDKSDYNIIDRVEYENGTQKETVYFNQNLNSIIGSRATGKSNLLKNIAYSIDFFQCEKKRITKEDFFNFINFKLFWKDSTANTLNESEEKEKGVLFIPQGYLGKIVYDNDQYFEEFVIDLFGNKDDFSNEIKKYKKFEDNNALEIASIIKELILIRNSGKNTVERLKKLGKSENIETDIKNLNAKINSINKIIGQITDKEIGDYQKFDREKTEKEKEILTIQKNIDSFTLLKEEEIITAKNIFEFEFSEIYIKKIQDKIKESDKNFKTDFIDEEIKNLKEDKKTKEKELSEISKKLKPLKEKVEKHKTILELTEKLKDKEKTKQEIIKLTEEKNKYSDDYAEKKNTLVDNYMKYSSEYEKFAIKIDNLEFSTFNIISDFNTPDFLNFLEENINYHNSITFKEENISKEKRKYEQVNAIFKKPNEFKFDEKKYKEILKQLMTGILANSLLLKARKDEETILLELFKNRFKINYLKSITKDGVYFNDMSDGEKMIALLEFIFKFDDYNYPIMLDQPEDDLDVRAISKYVVDFLRKQKIKRQIFIVSHNANLVVCGDSEEIVVARKKKKTDFGYKTGAIENDTIREEIIEVLEGGEEAIRKRKNKLGII